MKINYGYFRHRFDAHNDPKIHAIADKMGIVGIGYYYLLIEIYGAAYSSLDDKNQKVVLHIRSISSVWRQRNDYCLLNLSKLAAMGLLRFSNDSSMIELDIPNFPKYFGAYEHKSDNKRKEKEIKENEIKVNKSTKSIAQKNPKVSPLASLFKPDDPIQKWLLTGSEISQKELLIAHSHHVLAEEVKKAFLWQCEKKPRKAGTFLLTWMSNKKSHAYNPNQAQDRFKNKTNTVVATPENPTGNPYIQEAREKGYIA